jgi:DNA-binding NarL/FixJ family response regulator
VGRRPSRILVVDDDDLFRAWVREVLERAGFEVVDAGEAAEALRLFEETRPRVVLLDVRLPVSSGYEVHRELRERHAGDIPVLFVSGERTESFDRVAGLLLGADDYLVKPIDPDELVARVRRSLRWNGGANGHAAAHSEPVPDLTAREREVLALLASGLSTKQIATELVISPRTLGTHVQHILGKLGVHSRAQAVAFAHRGGLSEVSAHGLPRPAGPGTRRLRAVSRA